jgi:KDO2-lipid IV(A) lauroyltransferase
MPSRWRTVRQSLEYAAVRGALWLAARVPVEVGQRVGACLGVIAFDGARARRRVSEENITAALGVAPHEATRIARAAYANMGRSLMEFAAFARISQAEVLDLVRLEGTEHFEGLVSRGQGGVIVVAHHGNWELLGAAMRAWGVPLHFLVGEQTNRHVDGLMNDLRSREGIGIITRTFALRRVLEVLRRGEFVALLPDQDARRAGIMIEFLGRPASTVRGPALFALRSGCPIIPCLVHREGTRHRGRIDPPMYPIADADEDEAVRELTQRYTDRLAAHIRAYPSEYFWPHRRWKTKST